MRTLIGLFLTALISTLSFHRINAQNFYDPSAISSIEIQFYDVNWDYKLDSLRAADSDERILADITINGVLLDSAGVRYKGNSSYNASQLKNPLNIKLNYVNNNEYEGYNSLKLSNVFKDPSFVREVMAYEIVRKYMPASRAGYANVYINGSKFGLYTNVQVVDDIFTAEHYYSENRPFFEGDDPSSPPPMSCFSGPPTPWGFMGTDSVNCYPEFYDNKIDNSWKYIIHLLDTFNNQPSSMEEIYNIDRHLWAMAFDIGFVNLDAPISMTHNFYVYYDLANRFNYIKWDLNECFGVFVRFGSGPSSVNLTTTQMQQLDPFAGNSTDNPVVYKVWTQDRWKKMYIAHMKTIMEENIASGWYLTRAVELQTYIDTAVQNDPNKFYTYADFQNNISTTASGSVGISELMASRLTFLNSNSWFTATQPDISSITNNPSTVSAMSSVSINANITNANYVYLGYRYSVSDKFEKMEMFDDGSHNDGAASDGNWGATIPVYNSDIQYYIYAENNDAARFSPARAEYEFYTILVNGNVVVNEFMASNTTTASDQNGEYDDWIELYNNSSLPISLNGYYLSDEMGDPYKWQFPDTTIAANAYLIVWADNDTTQSGLHANFKLSAAGEMIVLNDAGKNLLDQISFTAQSSDISTGRYPNGTGSFTTMYPTFSNENMAGMGITDNEIVTEIVIYPNPANSEFTIGINDNNLHTVQLYSMDGKLLKSFEMTRLQTTGISNLENGIYIIVIDQSTNRKLIKAN